MAKAPKPVADEATEPKTDAVAQANELVANTDDNIVAPIIAPEPNAEAQATDPGATLESVDVIVLTTAAMADDGTRRDAGATLIVGEDIDAVRARDLIDNHRAYDPVALAEAEARAEAEAESERIANEQAD
jgi:hypothetical protein